MGETAKLKAERKRRAADAFEFQPPPEILIHEILKPIQKFEALVEEMKPKRPQKAPVKAKKR